MGSRLIGVLGLLVFSCGFTLAQAPAPDCAEMKTRLDRAETMLKDWPALARYSEENFHTPPAAMDGGQRVVFMGDSITDGWDDPKYGGFFPGKPYVFLQDLQD